MQRGLSTILIILCACFSITAKAQQQLFKNYTINDGLVSNSIRRILQDSKGFLWIATIEGLSKYDGNSFTNFTTANGLSHNLVNDFYEPKNGQLYIALNNGNMDKVAGENSIRNVNSTDIVVNRIIETPWHKVIAITDNKGLQEFSDGKLTQPLQDFPKSTFTEITIINDSALMVAGDGFIKIFNKKYKLIAETHEGYDIFSEIKIFQDSKKRIWVGSKDGLRLMASFPEMHKPIRFIPLPAPFHMASLLHAKISDIFEDADNALWFATSTGIEKINTDGSRQFINVKDGLISNAVNTIFQDKEKNIWFGTELGLSKLVTQSGITLYPIEFGVASSDNESLFHTFKRNNLLISTANGVEVFNKITGNFHLVANTKNKKIISTVSNTNPPLFIGHDGLSTFDTARLQFRKITDFAGTPASKIVSDIAGNLFSGDLNHLYFTSGNKQQTLLPYRIAALLIDKSGDLWAGTWNNGLFRLKYKVADTGLQILATRRFLINDNIRCLLEDSKGNIWAGTRYQGVYALMKNQKGSFIISNFNQASGLSSNFIKAIREDSYGNYWIAFFQGLDKLIQQDTGFRIFNFSRITNYYTTITGIESDANHTLWLGTTEGLVHIKDEELGKTPPLPVYITKIILNDSEYHPRAKKLYLNYRQNQIQFEFSSPGFINENQIYYSYRLSGYAKAEWSKPGNEYIVSYASLQPGSYVFEVRTLGWNGRWGTPAVFEFKIHPPFWQTGWFIAIASLCILLIIYLFVRWRVKNIKAITTEKLKVKHLNAEQYKSELELERVINYFTSSLIEKNTVDDVLWDVAKNLIGRLGFVDCMIYLWNDDKTKMIQKAGFGPKGTLEEISKQHFDVAQGQGVVGYVMRTKEPVLIPDTSKDSPNRVDEMARLSEITVPIIYNNELIGVIDCEHHEKNFFTRQHLQILNTIATLMGNKIKSIEAKQTMLHTQIKMYRINEQLSNARLEALRSQMNPHFIFNCLNSIDALIHSNDKYNATTYLNKFAKLLRNILDNSRQNTVAFSKDVETLKLYIELEVLRHENKFKVIFNIDDELLNSDYLVPPLIVQPFVENAILHGLKNKEGNCGTLTVNIIQSNDKLQYTITDNGIGRKAAEKISQNKESHYGLQITNERIRLFNKETKAAVHIADLYNNDIPEGTSVTIILNIVQ